MSRSNDIIQINVIVMYLHIAFKNSLFHKAALQDKKMKMCIN